MLPIRAIDIRSMLNGKKKTKISNYKTPWIYVHGVLLKVSYDLDGSSNQSPIVLSHSSVTNGLKPDAGNRVSSPK